MLCLASLLVRNGGWEELKPSCSGLGLVIQQRLCTWGLDTSFFCPASDRLWFPLHPCCVLHNFVPCFPHNFSSGVAYHGFLGSPKNSLLLWFSSHSCSADPSCVSCFSLGRICLTQLKFFFQLKFLSQTTKVAIALHRTHVSASFLHCD